MGEVVDLGEYRKQKLASQFSDEMKKRKRKQDLRERRENELEESVTRHPSKSRNKKFKDEE